VKRAVDPVRRALRRAIGAPGGPPYQDTIESLRADIVQLRRELGEAAEDAARADDRMADLLEELTAGLAELSIQRDAMAAELTDLGRRVDRLEANGKGS
jgi:hypothetical protein